MCDVWAQKNGLLLWNTFSIPPIMHKIIMIILLLWRCQVCVCVLDVGAVRMLNCLGAHSEMRSCPVIDIHLAVCQTGWLAGWLV